MTTHSNQPAGEPATSWPPDTDAFRVWVRSLDILGLPLLDHTVAELEVWRDQQDAIDAHGLAEELNEDPMLAVQVLNMAHQTTRGSRWEHAPAETITQALVTVGITPFFRTLRAPVGISAWFSGQPMALAHFENQLRAGRLSARLACAMAIHRQDHDTDALHLAALLHELPQLLGALWQAQRGHGSAADSPCARLSARPGQPDPFHLSPSDCSDLRRELVSEWKLPAWLQYTELPSEQQSPQARTISLAATAAHLGAPRWQDQDFAETLTAIARLTRLTADQALVLLTETAGSL